MSIWTDFRELFFPRLCLVCGKKLCLSEDLICFSCLSSLPYTRDLGVPGNEMEMLFWGRFPIERAFALYYYAHGGSVSRILASMKYLGRKDVCFKMGMLLAGRLLDVGFLDKADFLILCRSIRNVIIKEGIIKVNGWQKALGKWPANRCWQMLCAV